MTRRSKHTFSCQRGFQKGGSSLRLFVPRILHSFVLTLSTLPGNCHGGVRNAMGEGAGCHERIAALFCFVCNMQSKRNGSDGFVFILPLPLAYSTSAHTPVTLALLLNFLLVSFLSSVPSAPFPSSPPLVSVSPRAATSGHAALCLA